MTYFLTWTLIWVKNCYFLYLILKKKTESELWYKREREVTTGVVPQDLKLYDIIGHEMLDCIVKIVE